MVEEVLVWILANQSIHTPPAICDSRNQLECAKSLRLLRNISALHRYVIARAWRQQGMRWRRGDGIGPRGPQSEQSVPQLQEEIHFPAHHRCRRHQMHNTRVGTQRAGGGEGGEEWRRIWRRWCWSRSHNLHNRPQLPVKYSAPGPPSSPANHNYTSMYWCTAQHPFTKSPNRSCTRSKRRAFSSCFVLLMVMLRGSLYEGGSRARAGGVVSAIE